MFTRNRLKSTVSLLFVNSLTPFFRVASILLKSFASKMADNSVSLIARLRFGKRFKKFNFLLFLFGNRCKAVWP